MEPNPLMGVRMIHLGDEKTCGCGNTYFGQYPICPDCYQKEEDAKKRAKLKPVVVHEGQIVEMTESDRIKQRILRDEYFGGYFQAWGDKLDKQVEGWRKLCVVVNKNIIVELEKMDAWLCVHDKKKKWEVFITNWLMR